MARTWVRTHVLKILNSGIILKTFTQVAIQTGCYGDVYKILTISSLNDQLSVKIFDKRFSNNFPCFFHNYETDNRFLE